MTARGQGRISEVLAPFCSLGAAVNVTNPEPLVAHRLRFCVSSVDAVGNKSNLSCAQLTIR